jgi:hypothetical protein
MDSRLRSEAWASFGWLGYALAGSHSNMPALREETREGAIMTAIEHPIISALHAAARATVPYPVGLLAARRADFRAQIEAAQPVPPWTPAAWQAGDCEDGSDNSLSGSLNDAGFGSQGPM